MFAKQVVDEDLEYRPVFTPKTGSANVAKHIKFSYLKEKVAEFVGDLLGEVEGLRIAGHVRVCDVHGFESTSDFYHANGFAKISSIVFSASGVRSILELYVPIYKGVLLKPSIMTINGKRRVFSRSELEYYLTSSETVLCQLDGQFTSRPAISHKSNDRTNMFGS
ncbi:MAG: hypothetical protein WC444_05495, partial [Candidatus Paceibacterota bacterium]